MSYWLDLHFMKRGKEIWMVEMEGGRNYHLSDTARSFCWADSNIQGIYQVFCAAQNSLLNDELTGVQELFYYSSQKIYILMYAFIDGLIVMI